MCQPVLDSENLEMLENWIDVLDSVAELELEEKFLRSTTYHWEVFWNCNNIFTIIELIKLQIKRLGDKNLIVADLLVSLGGEA